MSRLVISAQDLETLSRHGARTFPEECCGFLVGRSSEEETTVERAVAVDNERADSRHNRYVIAPETVLATQKEARDAGLDIVGYYHSHPDHPAIPSDFDREHAWPGVSYLIVSVLEGEVAAARSWRLADDRERFVEEAIEPVAAAPALAAPGLAQGGGLP